MRGKVIKFATPLQIEKDLKMIDAFPYLTVLRIGWFMGSNFGKWEHSLQEWHWRLHALTWVCWDQGHTSSRYVTADQEERALWKSHVQANYKLSGRRNWESRAADSSKLRMGIQVAAEEQVWAQPPHVGRQVHSPRVTQGLKLSDAFHK